MTASSLSTAPTGEVARGFDYAAFSGRRQHVTPALAAYSPRANAGASRAVDSRQLCPLHGPTQTGDSAKYR